MRGRWGSRYLWPRRVGRGVLDPSRLRILAATCLLAGMLVASAASATEVALILHPDRVLNQIDEKVYGHFLEHIYHSCNGGLWGELVWDRSFEGGGGGANWLVEDGLLAQQGTGADVRLLFGQPDWTDYEITLDARKTGGDEGFLVLLRARNAREFYWANLGGWGNAGHALERGIRGQERWGPVTPRRPGRIQTDRWYRIRARCEGRRIQVWLDDELVIDYTDDGRGPAAGRPGVGTWQTQAQFRAIKVVALDGRTLFEGLPPLPEPDPHAVPQWFPFGAVKVSVATDNPLNAAQCRKLEAPGPLGGLAQQPLCIRAGERYQGSLWVRGQAEGGLVVRLVAGGQVLAEQLLPPPGAQWQEMAIDLRAAAGSPAAALQIGIRGPGTVWLDQVSLMPAAWRANGGFRAELLRAIAELQPPLIRWPGGCFASSYRWKQGIGAQHKRLPHPRAIWDDRDVYSFGTDEFIAFCRQVGAEPLIVVNIGTPNWNRDAGENDYLQEVLDWLEYCNGAADSQWGRLRAANGHPEPYNVKYWEIDNETWHLGAERYAECVNRFAPAMRQKDPAIKLVACGSGSYDLRWDRTVISLAGRNFDYLSTHHYENPNNYAAGPARAEAFFRQLQEIIAEGPNPGIKIFHSEWNAQSTDWRTGLYCGGILNVFERCGGVVEMGAPALFLRHVSATAWDNAFINFDQCGWFPAPNYVVMKLWREHYAPQRIAVELSPPPGTPEGKPGRLDTLATRSADGKTLYLKAVNPADEPCRVALRLARGTIRTASMQVVAPGELSARNSLDAPQRVRPEPGAVEQQGQTVRFVLPPLSCAAVKIGCD